MEFSHSIAKRSQVPLLVGFSGPSGGGKTYSALRLATGIQSVSGGDIFGIDTESNRMCHYADKFKFQHVPFAAPFGSLRYLEAIQYCVKNGAKVIVIDSMSHEHEGEGGMVDSHANEVSRMAKGDWEKAERVKMLAWTKPKADRRRLLNSILQINCNFIFCFRAKDKIKPVKGKDPIHLGYMPIAGEEFVFEMTTTALLLPGAGGIPQWNPANDGERSMVKLPEQFRNLLLNHKGPIDETIGRKMAEWARGDAVANDDSKFRDSLINASTNQELADAWNKIPQAMKASLSSIKDQRKAEIASQQPKDSLFGNEPQDFTASKK